MGEGFPTQHIESEMPVEDFSNMTLEALWLEHDAYISAVRNHWDDKEFLDGVTARYTAVVTANMASMAPLSELIAARSRQAVHDLPR